LSTIKKKITLEKTSVTKDSLLIRMEHQITLLQQQVWNVMLAYAYDKLDQDLDFKLPIVTLLKYIPAVSNRKHLERAVTDLVERQLRFDAMADNRPDESCSLLSSARFNAGICHYQFPRCLKQRIFSSSTNSEIDLLIQKQYKGGAYGWFLYELCFDAKDSGSTGWISLTQLRRFWGIFSDRYPLFKDLNKRVIKPAIRDVNSRTDIFINAELKRNGKKVVGIRFDIDSSPDLLKKTPSNFSESIDRDRDVRPVTGPQGDGLPQDTRQERVLKKHPSSSREKLVVEDTLKKRIFHQIMDHLIRNSASYQSLGPLYQAEFKREISSNYISVRAELSEMISDSVELADSFYRQQVAEATNPKAALKEAPETIALEIMTQALKDAEQRILQEKAKDQMIDRHMAEARTRAEHQRRSEKSSQLRDIEAIAEAGRRVEQRLEIENQWEKEENEAAIREARRKGIERLKHLLN